MRETATPVADDLDARIGAVLASPSEPVAEAALRAEELLADVDAIVWEGDAATFEFSYVSPSAERILGHPVERWTTEPSFWAETVVHPEDSAWAVSYCALATGQGRDHEFEYRAVAADGTVTRLRDVVRVVFDGKTVPQRLRGVMVVVPDAG